MADKNPERDLEKLADWFTRLKPRLVKEVREELRTQAEITMTESKREIPVDTGYAQSTAVVGSVISENGELSVRFGYSMETAESLGGTPYIVPLHERVNVNHVNGKAHFLRDPVMASEKRLNAAMNKAFARAMAKSRPVKGGS